MLATCNELLYEGEEDLSEVGIGSISKLKIQEDKMTMLVDCM